MAFPSIHVSQRQSARAEVKGELGLGGVPHCFGSRRDDSGFGHYSRPPANAQPNPQISTKWQIWGRGEGCPSAHIKFIVAAPRGMHIKIGVHLADAHDEDPCDGSERDTGRHLRPLPWQQCTTASSARQRNIRLRYCVVCSDKLELWNTKAAKLSSAEPRQREYLKQYGL